MFRKVGDRVTQNNRHFGAVPGRVVEVFRLGDPTFYRVAWAFPHGRTFETTARAGFDDAEWEPPAPPPPPAVPVTPELVRRVLVVMPDGETLTATLAGPLGCGDGCVLLYEVEGTTGAKRGDGSA